LPGTFEGLLRYELGRKLDFDPGTKHYYSSFGYEVLGLIIEEVSGELYEDFVIREVLHTIGASEAAKDAWYRHWIAVGFSGLEQEARRATGDGRHMFGSTVTIADIYIVPQMYNARRFKCDVEPYPTLRGICAHLESLPAFAKAVPEAHPSAAC